MTGLIVSVTSKTMTIVEAPGSSTHSAYPVADDARITLNGAPVKLVDLRQHDRVTWSGDPATNVAATR